MSQGLAIAALILSVISIFASFPFALLVVWTALAVATLAALGKGRGLAIAAWIVCAVSLLFLSPLTLFMLSESAQGRGPRGPIDSIVTLILFVAPVVAAIVGALSSAGRSQVKAPEPFTQPASNGAPDSSAGVPPFPEGAPLNAVRYAFVFLIVAVAGVAGYVMLQRPAPQSAYSNSQRVSGQETAPATGVEVTPPPASGMPPVLDRYFRLLIARDYEGAFRLTPRYQRELKARSDSVRQRYPQSMWPERLAEAEREAMEELWNHPPNRPKVMDRSQLPLIDLFRAGARWSVVETRGGGSLFVEISYADSGPDSTTPFVSVTSVQGVVPMGQYVAAPLKRVIVDITTGDTAAIFLWSYVPGSDQWFDWPMPAIVGVELSDGGLQHFGRDPIIVDPNDPYLPAYKVNLYVYGGRPPYKSIQFGCRDKTTGAESFSHQFASSERTRMQKLSAQGQYEFAVARYPQICVAAVRDDAGNEAKAELEMVDAPEVREGYGDPKALCWRRNSLDIENAYTARCGGPAGLLGAPTAWDKVASPKPAEQSDIQVQTIKDCPLCPEMVIIPGGSFVMGSPQTESGRNTDEGPQRQVSIRSFAVSRNEITFAQWDACVAGGGCTEELNDNGWGRGTRPVIHVTWGGAQAYAKWLSRQTGKTYRLLTESEWEYAARAGTTTAFPWGKTASHSYANYGQGARGVASGRDQWENTGPVGSFPSNAFGLYDMHGNVSEWVEDCRTENYSSSPSDGSPSVSGDCDQRVLRGGSWNSSPAGLRSATRGSNMRWAVYDNIGFRVARAN